MNNNLSAVRPIHIEQQIMRELVSLLPASQSSLRKLGRPDLNKCPGESYRSLIEELRSIAEGTIFLLSFDCNIEQAKKSLLAVMALLGQAVQVEANERSFWYPLGVDLEASPDAGGGVRENPLHIDMLTFSGFPTGMAILCERPDPKNGGDTYLSPLDSYRALEPEHICILRSPSFSYWKDEGLEQVGDHLSCFPVLPAENNGRVRFTSKLPKWIGLNVAEELHTIEIQEKLQSISLYTVLLQSNLLKLRLERGQAVLFSQLHYAHGRSSLGSGQSDVPAGIRRQLWRAYFNWQKTHPRI